MVSGGSMVPNLFTEQSKLIYKNQRERERERESGFVKNWMRINIYSEDFLGSL